MFVLYTDFVREVRIYTGNKIYHKYQEVQSALEMILKQILLKILVTVLDLVHQFIQERRMLIVQDEFVVRILTWMM